MWMGGQATVRAALPPEMPRNPLYRAPRPVRVCAEISPPPEFDPWNVQSVASCYTDWATPAHEGYDISSKTSDFIQVGGRGWEERANQFESPPGYRLPWLKRFVVFRCVSSAQIGQWLPPPPTLSYLLFIVTSKHVSLISASHNSEPCSDTL